jgi:hypothetical protein
MASENSKVASSKLPLSKSVSAKSRRVSRVGAADASEGIARMRKRK